MSNISSVAQQNFGTTWGGIQDVTSPALMVTGNTSIAQMIIKRFTTPRGRLMSDPNFGLDLTQYVSKTMSAAQLSSLAKQCNAEAAKDERVSSASISLVFTLGTITISGTVTMAAGNSFAFVGVIGQVGGLLVTTLASIVPG